MRGANAPALPSKVRVTYRFPGGAAQERVFDLRDAMQQAKGEGAEALVFELRPDGSVATYLDQVQP